MDVESDRICAEFHVLHDPVANLRARMRELALECIVTFSDPTVYDREGRARAIAEWRDAMPALVGPATPPVRSFAGRHLSWDGYSVLEVCRIIAADAADRGITLTPTALAREATRVLQGGTRLPQHAIVAVTWRAARMPVSVTGTPFADPETGTITTRVQKSDASLTRLRRGIKARYGRILEWSVAEVQARDPATFDRDPDELDESLLRQIQRLLERHDLGQGSIGPLVPDTPENVR